MSCGVGCRGGLDPALLWLWSRPAATAPTGPLAWEPLYVMEGALEKVERQKKKKNWRYLILVRMLSAWNSHPLLVVMPNPAATLENGFKISYEIEHKITI